MAYLGLSVALLRRTAGLSMFAAPTQVRTIASICFLRATPAEATPSHMRRFAMATTAKKTTKKTAGATPRNTASKKTAKRTTKKTTAKQSTKQTGAKSSTQGATKQSAAKSQESSSTGAPNPSALSLLEREPKAVLESAGYAAVSVAHEAVTMVRSVPAHLGHAAKSVPAFLRNAPEHARDTVGSVSTRISRDAKQCVSTFTTTLDNKAEAGKKVVDEFANSERVDRVREHASTTREKAKGTATSVKKAASEAADAAEDDVTQARSEAKGAATSAKRVVAAAEDGSDN